MTKRNLFNLRYAQKGRWKKEKKKMLHTFKVIEAIHDVRKIENPIEIQVEGLSDRFIQELEHQASKYGCSPEELASAFLLIHFKDKS